ncbi:MAG: N-formylglutamate amidohydrolase [Gammaproteobacteria bacterium]|nr:N-formylglutamate amidohydrolase [Gammaproteobacteria bacterium]
MALDQDLLGPNEPGPFEVVNPNGQGSLVLICDHASNRVPASLHNLGLSEQELASHIGWDPGAALVARKLVTRFDAPLLLSNYSRLVIDCNRWPSDPESIPATSGGVAIPGNMNLTDQEADRRHQHLFEPYQAAVAALLTESAQQPRLLLSIHSFTPSLGGIDRPWPLGVCYRHNVDLAQRWIEVIENRIRESSIGSFPVGAEELIGDNQPYEIEADCDYTIPVQGESRSIPSIMLELRQDEIQDEEGVELWSDIIAESWLTL